MRIVLQRAKDLTYFSINGRWTQDLREAFEFDGIIRAVDYALNAGLHNVWPLLNVVRCPLEVLELVNGFARRPEVT
jgi:hypothetical protein